jgi:hypothetical protein
MQGAAHRRSKALAQAAAESLRYQGQWKRPQACDGLAVAMILFDQAPFKPLRLRNVISA